MCKIENKDIWDRNLIIFFHNDPPEEHGLREINFFHYFQTIKTVCEKNKINFFLVREIKG